MNSIEKLTELFREFPGIGPRQAKRFSYFLLRKNHTYIQNLSQTISHLKNEVTVCSSCFQYFQKEKNTNNKLCLICRDKNRDENLLMVVQKDVDFETVERSKTYNGYYFILGGSVPILAKEPNKSVRLKELFKQVEARLKTGLQEIILAMNADAEGENTAEQVKKILQPLIKKQPLRVSKLGRGLSTGSELEYSDADTIVHALKNRE